MYDHTFYSGQAIDAANRYVSAMRHNEHESSEHTSSEESSTDDAA